MNTNGLSKDSMRSTWRTAHRSEWNSHHWSIEILNIHPQELDKPVPVHQKNEKLPYVPQWSLHRWVLFYTALPLLLHQAYTTYTSHRLGPIAIFNLYFLAFNATGIHQVHVLRRLGHTYGFLDGDEHPRDGVPDVGIGKVVTSLYKTIGSRLILAIYLTYNRDMPPSQLAWVWLPLEIGLYGIVLDFWFYWYHRLMHDISFLWKFHRTHHLTKHPNALLAAYADNTQEFFDMVGVPLMTWLTLRSVGMPMGYYEWYICHQYVAFAEVFGHSGLRVHLTSPSSLSWLLQWVGAEIVIEDHDLHHRKGWRKSHNYGKQTHLWDKIFGTCTDRIESQDANVDYVNVAKMPLF